MTIPEKNKINGKHDWFVRGLLLILALLIAAEIYVQYSYSVGRYAPLGTERVLDTRTGKVYAPYEGKVVAIDLVEMAKEQAKQRETQKTK